VAQFLIIVSRAAPAHAAYLQHAFAEMGDVILDRRVATRRRRHAPTAVDRRRRDRRLRDVTPELGQFGWAVVRRPVPIFLRRWIALEGHQAALRQALLLVHETDTRKSPHVIESLMYREHFLGAEFTGLIVYDDEASLEATERQHALARLDAIATAHTKFSTPPLRVEMIGALTRAPRGGPYGVAGLLSCQPAFATEFAGRLKGLTAELVERLRPTRMLVGEVVDRPGLFVVLGDSNYPVDLDRYLQSSLHRQHATALGSLLTAPTRWFSLDPVWRYVRAGTV